MGEEGKPKRSEGGEQKLGGKEKRAQRGRMRGRSDSPVISSFLNVGD
jgi:hypothetical protein